MDVSEFRDIDRVLLEMGNGFELDELQDPLPITQK
jgi:hypothetical protein